MSLPKTPPLIVLGMHRSGTSLVARSLSDMGAHMGREVEDNHEAVAFLRTNNDLLGLAGSYWAKPKPFLAALGDESFVLRCTGLARRAVARRLPSYGEASGAPAWGFKDPRSSLTLPIWRRVFPDARVLHVVRDGIDVTSSLCRRELRRWTHRVVERRMLPTPGRAYGLWHTYVEAACRALADHTGPSLTIRYEDLVAEPAGRLDKIAAFAGLPRLPKAAGVGRVRGPSERCEWVVAWLRCLDRAGRLDTERLSTFGYKLP